jgi:hypothetical protein
MMVFSLFWAGCTGSKYVGKFLLHIEIFEDDPKNPLAWNDEANVVGVVVAGYSGLPLPGASISLKESEVTTFADTSGYFSFTAPMGTQTVVVSFVGMLELSCSLRIKEKKRYFLLIGLGHGAIR